MLLALCRGAELLILDEPTEALDPAVIEDALHAVVTLAADDGTTVFFSSHQLAEVEQIADRVCINQNGAAGIHAFDARRLECGVAGRSVEHHLHHAVSGAQFVQRLVEPIALLAGPI